MGNPLIPMTMSSWWVNRQQGLQSMRPLEHYKNGGENQPWKAKVMLKPPKRGHSSQTLINVGGCGYSIKIPMS